MSVAEFQESTLAIGLASQIAALSQQQLCQLLSRASTRVDRFTRRKIGAPLATTIDPASSGVLIGATTIPVTSTLSIDSTENQCVVLGSSQSGNYEIVPITSVTTTNYATLQGTVTLATGTTYAHPINEPLQYAWRETYEVGSSSSIDEFTEAITQQAQIAAAHQPVLTGGNMVRVIYTNSYPIQHLLDVQGSYSYSNGYFPIESTGAIIVPTEGYFLIPLGEPLYEGSFTQTTYIGGFTNVPEDIKSAVMWYVADEMMLTNYAYAQGMVRMTEGKVTQQWQPMNAQGKSVFVQNAENLLKQGGYMRRV